MSSTIKSIRDIRKYTPATVDEQQLFDKYSAEATRWCFGSCIAGAAVGFGGAMAGITSYVSTIFIGANYLPMLKM